MLDQEILIVQKATVFDLLHILGERPDKSYSVTELEAIMSSYIREAENNK